MDLLTAKTLQIQDIYGLEPGKPCSLIIVDGTDPWDLMRRMPVTTCVIYRGRVV
ncbi:hypothetical protein [Paenibacillus beijingensis]|uniref:hypothetical protein n=1 Tax=Paenibacillus beijingensis TaxID=1126833 RepID=UPI000AB4B4DC|nr:hypothetical protein [Paenibacillus beijingensis]